jgi:BirA family biotin operon repressor/biotin-[acetyl-CoA-carboxylase] ligase
MPAPTAPSLPGFFQLQSFDCLASSNDEAKRQAAEGAPEGTLIVCRRQSAGRGRRGRRWESPPGNLYASLLLRPGRLPPEAAQLAFVAAVALTEALGRWLAPERTRLKWPNDVLVDGAKVAGILAESASGAGGPVDWLVLGIGVNIESHPTGPGYDATSLHALGKAVSAAEVLAALAPALESWYRRWCREGFAPVRGAWLAQAHGLGAQVSARAAAGVVEGIVECLDRDGALIVRRADGGQARIEAGEVLFVS